MKIVSLSPPPVSDDDDAADDDGKLSFAATPLLGVGEHKSRRNLKGTPEVVAGVNRNQHRILISSITSSRGKSIPIPDQSFHTKKLRDIFTGF